MNPQTEYYMEFLITEAFKGKGFQKISELFEEKLSCSTQRHGKALLNQMDKLINKELDRNEFAHVSLLMKCIQHFCKSENQEALSLIQQGLVGKMVLWFERTLEFLKIFVETDPSIAKLVEEFYDTAVVISKSNNKDGIKQILDSFLFNLGFVITEKWPAFDVRLEAVKTFNLILDHVPREDKKSLQSSEEMRSLMKAMSRKLFEVGDYDVQVAISEGLCRMTPKKLREKLAQEWFEDSFFAKAFVEINDQDFETDCRHFLNLLNSKSSDAVRVFTFPCVNAFADMVQLQRPEDDKLKDFWIDFNVGSRCVSFYVQNNDGNLWDSVRLQKTAVAGYEIQETNGQQLLSVFTKTPIRISNTETKHVRIFFESEHNIENAIIKTFGEDLKMVNDNHAEKIEIISTVEQSEEATSQGHPMEHLNLPKADATHSEVDGEPKVQSPSSVKYTFLQEETLPKVQSPFVEAVLEAPKQDPVLITSEDSLKDSTKTIVSAAEKTPIIICRDVRVVLSPVEKRLTENVKDATPKHLETKQRSPVKHLVEKASSFDFPDSSFSGTDVEILPKEKINSPASASRSFTGKGTSRRPVTRSFSETKKAVHYIDSSISSESGSEKSWVREQKKSGSKSADYSRKRPKPKSRLRVLPLSASSNDDTSEKKNTSSSFTSIKKTSTQVKGIAESLRFPGANLPGVSALLTPGDSMQLSSVCGTNDQSDLDDKDIMDPLQDMSSPERTLPVKVSIKDDFKSAVTTRSAPIIAVKAGEDEPQKKRKRASDGDQELMFRPRKLFSSSDRNLGNPEDVLKVNPDGLNLPEHSFTSSFDTFTRDLKSKMMSAYKKMENQAQDMLTMSHMHVSSLIGQIQECKIRKLQHFRELVTQELSALEADNQALGKLEKETMEMWETQSVKIKEFCVNQAQRLEARVGDSKSFQINEKIEEETTHQKSLKQ